MPVLALMSHRPGWDPPWTDWTWVERLEVGPLRERDSTLLVEEVLGGMEVSPELNRYVAERAAGNPLFVEELLRMLRGTGGLIEQHGVVQLAAETAERLPTTLTEIVLARLDGLDGEARDLARVASVIGRRFGVRLVAQLMQSTPPALEPALATLVQADLVFPSPTPDSEYVFKHMIVRDVAYSTLLQRPRQELHAAAARAIARVSSGEEYVEIIAYHYSRTPRHADAALWLERAADRARAVYANELALQYYNEARDRLQRSGADEIALARIDEKHGALLKMVARYVEALEVLERALLTYSSAGEREGELRVLAQIGRVHIERGTADEGLARLRPVLDGLPSGATPSVLADLHAAAAHIYYRVGMYTECVAAAERAEELARAIGDTRVLADAQYRRGWTLLAVLGNHEEGLRVTEGAIPAAENCGDPDILQAAMTATGIGYWAQGDLERAKGYFERTLVVIERMGNLMRRGWVVAWCGYCAFFLGDWKQARVLLERAADMYRSVESYYAASALTWLGQLCLAEGKWEEATHVLEEAALLGERTGNLDVFPLAHGLLAEISLLESRPAALSRLEDLAALKNMGVHVMLPILAWGYLMTGDDRAEPTAAAAVEAARKHTRLALVDALRVQSLVLTAQQRWDEAERALDEAVSMAEKMAYPYGMARALHAHGILQIQRGVPEHAPELLARALEIFQALDARKDAERTQRALKDSAGAR